MRACESGNVRAMADQQQPGAPRFAPTLIPRVTFHSPPDPPPAKCSDLKYISTSRRTAMARKEVAAGGCSGLPRSEHGRRDPPDWCERSHLLSLTPGVRRAEDREAPEGARTREQPAAQGGLRFDAGQAHSAGGRAGKLLSPAPDLSGGACRTPRQQRQTCQ